ncbi:hypothetical protein ILYODFUR_017379, partial [Ilyodon furcidens]
GLKMSRKIRGFCVALLLTLTSVYAARRSLNSINDLVICHQSDRTNILELLHWFANEVEIDQYNVIRLTFDPNTRAYGTHHYRNQEGLLDPLPWGYQNYTIGNIHQTASERLPSYVVNSRMRNIVWNSARILIRVNERRLQVGQIIEEVYITQHYGTSENHGSNYDPDHTYRITVSFLNQLRKVSIDEIQRRADGSQSTPFRNTSDAHSQDVDNRNQYTQIYIPDTPTIQDDCLGDCMRMFCCFIFVLLIIFLFVSWSYFGNWRK